MKEVILNNKQNKIKIILGFFIISITLYFLIFNFLINPEENTSFLLRSKEIVFVFSLFGISTCLLGIYIIIKPLFFKNKFIKINYEGIYDGFSFYDKKFIKWDEISRIETFRHNYNNYIAIFPKKKMISKDKGINRFLYKLNEIIIGTPFIITSGNLECSFKELEETINIFFNKYKK